MTTYVLFAIAIFLLVILMKAVKIVPQKQVDHRADLESTTARGSRPQHNLSVHRLGPRNDRPARADQKIEPQAAITRDNVTMEGIRSSTSHHGSGAGGVRSPNLKWGIEQLRCRRSGT